MLYSWCYIFLFIIFKETLRLYPITPIITRMTWKPCAISGYDVPGQTSVFVSREMYLVQQVSIRVAANSESCQFAVCQVHVLNLKFGSLVQASLMLHSTEKKCSTESRSSGPGDRLLTITRQIIRPRFVIHWSIFPPTLTKRSQPRNKITSWSSYKVDIKSFQNKS